MKRILIITALMCLVPVCMKAQMESSAVSCRVKGVLQDSLTMLGEEYATGRVYKKETPDKMDKAFVTQGGGGNSNSGSRKQATTYFVFPLWGNGMP